MAWLNTHKWGVTDFMINIYILENKIMTTLAWLLAFFFQLTEIPNLSYIQFDHESFPENAMDFFFLHECSPSLTTLTKETYD